MFNFILTQKNCLLNTSIASDKYQYLINATKTTPLITHEN
jgi:hypothetical protein